MSHPFLFYLVYCFSNITSITATGLETVTYLQDEVHPVQRIGYIALDAALDDPAFKLCAPNYVWIYSPFNGVGYKGEKPALVNAFKSQFRPIEDPISNGYITIRFMVNCEGKSGRFRLTQIDEEYALSGNIDSGVVDQILEITKSLDGWQRNYYEGTYYDYHQYLTFKIKKGNIIEYLP